MYVGCLGSSLVVLELNVQGCNLHLMVSYLGNGNMNCSGLCILCYLISKCGSFLVNFLFIFKPLRHGYRCNIT